MKRFFLFIATVAMASFVACGSGDSKEDGGNNGGGGGGDTKTAMSNTVWNNNMPVSASELTFDTRSWTLTTGGIGVASGGYHTFENNTFVLYASKDHPEIKYYTGVVSGSTMTMTPGSFGTFTKK